MRMRACAAALVLVVLAAAPGSAATGRGVPGPPTEVTGGLSIPWAVAWLPSGAAALVTQRDDSRVLLVRRDGHRTDLGRVPDSENTAGEGGLLGVAVAPSWDGAGERDVYFLHAAAEGIRVARMAFDGRALSGYRVVVRGIGKSAYHTGGALAFGPDGYLYATTGDVSRPGLAQDPRSLNGKVLRFTTEGEPAPGNRFRSLVYSLGHRNPQGLAWDSAGRLWSTELGQDAHDELNLIESGRNYGWPVCEGACRRPPYTDPAHTWAPSEASPSGLAIVGDVAYVASLRGRRLWRVELSGTRATAATAHFTGRYGRLRAVSAVPGSRQLWLGTSNADGVGRRPAGSDRLLSTALAP